MILTKELIIKTSHNKKLKHYKSLGYDISMEYISINIEHAPKYIGNVIKVKCDYCLSIHDRKVVDYNRIVDKNIDKKYACSRKCGVIKSTETINKTEKKPHPNLGKKIEIHKSKKINNKRKNTNLLKYGVEHVLQNKLIQDKFKETHTNKYGVDNYSKTEEFLTKQKLNNLQKYGIEHISQIKSVREKTTQTNLKRYGVKSTLNSDISNKRRREKFQTEEHRGNYEISNHENYLNYIGNSVSLFICDCDCDHTFEIKYDNFQSRLKFNIPLCTTCHPIGNSTSIKEQELFNLISELYKGNIIQSYRDGLEIDIYLPELKIGFEFNGVWWHSNVYKNKNYHINKLNHFKDKGIKIIYVWEDDWIHKNDIIKSQIGYLLKTSKTIGARKCIVREIIDTKTYKDFLIKNHVQGYVKSKIKLGLYYNNTLVSLMTFDHSEGRKKMIDSEWNLSRFCNAIDMSVVGGASKLLKYFIDIFHPTRIISYGDSDWSRGNLYYKLGFSKLHDTKPDYKYLVNNTRIHKSRFRKSYTGISESSLDLPKVWDCGKIKFEKKL